MAPFPPTCARPALGAGSGAPALRTIADHESSFNPAAANLAAAGGNPAGAPQGLMRMPPSTFAAHARPGHGDILDPVDNLMAAIDYIGRRYGDPSSTRGCGPSPGAGATWANQAQRIPRICQVRSVQVRLNRVDTGKRNHKD